MSILTTARCGLRPFIKNDAEFLIPILGSESVMRYSMTGALELSSISLVLKDWMTLYEQRGFSPWAIMYQNQLIGYAGFDIREL